MNTKPIIFFTTLILISILSFFHASARGTDYSIGKSQNKKAKAGLKIKFEEEKHKFTADDKDLIAKIIVQSEKQVRALLPELAKDIKVTVTAIDRKIEMVGGVTGRADAPGEVLIEISRVFPGGVTAAAKTALASAIFHEFHHLWRGWTINGNKFEQGIPIAAVNEGLAVVFAEKYTGVISEGNSYPKEVSEWVKEIMVLPKNADYQKWMMQQHPDGRVSIGYKVGNYLIRRAMTKSGKDVLELSNLSPDEILKLAGAM